MSLKINSEIPNIFVETSQGAFFIHDWLGEHWGIIFSHPKDFTPVCTTELGALAHLEKKFSKRGTKIIAISVDSIEDHQKWILDVNEVNQCKVNFPIIADTSLEFSRAYEMLPADDLPSDTRTAADNATVRVVYIVGSDKKVKAALSYPMSSGRNFDEIERLLDSCQMTAKYKVATPANWKKGQEVIISPSVTDDEAKKLFNKWKSPKPYLRFVDDPS